MVPKRTVQVEHIQGCTAENRAFFFAVQGLGMRGVAAKSTMLCNPPLV